jgi:hypothetical protein
MSVEEFKLVRSSRTEERRGCLKRRALNLVGRELFDCQHIWTLREPKRAQEADLYYLVLPSNSDVRLNQHRECIQNPLNIFCWSLSRNHCPGTLIDLRIFCQFRELIPSPLSHKNIVLHALKAARKIWRW